MVKKKINSIRTYNGSQTLIISKLNHLFIALPNPSDELINNLQKNFLQFIWQSGTDRVKRDLLMQEYNIGGLKMTNLKNYICALKSTWIRRLILNDSKYKTMFEANYSNIKEIVNRGLEFVRKMLNDKTNKFWNDVLGSWIEICNKQYPTNVEDVLLTNIWDNKYIKIDNKAFFYRKWHEKNIHFIKDILNDEGNLMDFNQFRDQYDL